MLSHIIQSIQLFVPESTLLGGFCILLAAGIIFPANRTALGWLTLLVLMITGYGLFREFSGGSYSIFSNMMAVDSFSFFFRTVILVASGFVVIFSLQSRELNAGRRSLGEYYALILSLTLGMFLMTGASNLLMMYLSLELTSMSSYILAGYIKEADDSSEASLKYILYGAVSSGIMLYGISILYGLTGSVDIYGVQKALMLGDYNTLALLIAGIFIVAGFGYKISAVPFHFWTPDVYEGAPITITAFLSVASKAAGFAMLIRFFKVSFFDATIGNLPPGYWAVLRGFEWNNVLAILSVLTMTLGNLTAIWQTNMKRLLAYSSIAHAGYMLLGVVVLSNQGIAAVLVYFAVYLFMNLGAFYCVMLVADATGSEDIEDYRGLGYRTPLLGVALTLFLLSLSGIPPTAGFVGKLYIFAALVNAKMIALAVVGVLNSVVSLYYYVRVLRNMFLRAPVGAVLPLKLSPARYLVLLVLAVPTLLLGLYFGPLVEYAQASVSIFGIR
jgi:NADH-quinone oxidoreductase subunit N